MEHVVKNGLLLEVRGVAFALCHPVRTLKRILRHGGIENPDELCFSANEWARVCTIVCPNYAARRLAETILLKKTAYTVVPVDCGL